MFKLNCLLKDTTIIKSAVEYIEALIGEAQTVNEASINYLYNKARKEGIEMDFESFAFAYSQVKNSLDPNEEFMTSEDDINKSSPKDIENAVENILKEAKEKEISNLSPEKQVLLNLLKLFNTSIKEPGGKSVMRELQDVVLKKTLSLLDKEMLSKVATKPTFNELIKLIVENNEIGIEKTDGSMNTVASLVKAVKEEIASIESEIPASKKAEFQQFTKAIESGLMDIVLSNSEIKSLINNSLIDNGFFKVINGKKVVDWGKVMDGTTIENDKFEPISYDFNSLRESIVNTLSKSTTPEWAETLADAIKGNIEDKIAEKKAKVLKIPKSAVQKLMTYSSLAQEQMGKEATNAQNGNYLIELSKLLNIDKTLQHNIDPKAVADILELYNGLDKILSSTSAKDMTILLMTPTVKNWIDRQITKIVNDHGLTLSNVDILARTLESFMVLKGLTLSNPYNITQNIAGNLFELISSLDALQEVFSKKGSGNLSDFLNIDEVWANMKSVGSGEVENTGKSNAAIDEIDLVGSMNTIASSEWKGGLKGKNVSDYAMWVAKKIKRISDVALNSFDAGGSSFLLNRYVLTTLRDLAYAKAVNDKVPNPEEEVNKVIQAYLGEVGNKTNIKNTLAKVNEEVDKQIASGVEDIDQIRQNVLDKLGKTNKVVQNAIHVKFIMDRMDKSITKDTNMARRLFYEVSRGTLVSDIGLDNSSDTISQTGNTMALMLLGKKSDQNALFHFLPKAAEGVTGWASERLKKLKKEGDLKAMHVVENMIFRLNMLFIVGASRWNVIASKFTPIGFYDAYHTGNKKAVRSSKNSEAYKKEIERILKDADNKNTKAATDLAEFYKKRHDFNSAIIGTTLGIIITAMLTRDDDDEFLNAVLNEEPGSGKLVSKLIQQVPLAYIAGMTKKDGVIGFVRGILDVWASRYPSANEKNRDYADRLRNATKDETIEKIKDEAFYASIVFLSDFFTVPIPEMFRTFRDFTATDKTWSPSPKRAKPDDVFEALFNKGMIRAILESTYDFGIYDQSTAQKANLKRNEELKAKREKK